MSGLGRLVGFYFGLVLVGLLLGLIGWLVLVGWLVCLVGWLDWWAGLLLGGFFFWVALAARRLCRLWSNQSSFLLAETSLDSAFASKSYILGGIGETATPALIL